MGSPEVRVLVQVRGLGPRFTLDIALQNTGQQVITGVEKCLFFVYVPLMIFFADKFVIFVRSYNIHLWT